MSTSERRESPLVRFLDSFLQEKNIKWVLATGLLILLGSSLMMVTRGWAGFDPTIKFLVIMGYTAAIFVAGQWCYHQLSLRKTGTVLLAFTVLMIPATFVAWHWLWSSVDATSTRGIAGVLLALNTGLATFAAQRTFAHFFRQNQATFLVSFLLLSLAGAVAPMLRASPPVWSWLGGFALWAVFSIGVVKINRHVFWLMEEHRQPRIFGFFPIALLGTQFLLVFATNFATRIPADWFGMACVLVAVPMLLTADSVAKVYQARTGDIVRPIPWTIMLPLCVGILLCVAGIGLASSGLAWGIPYAIVPTAALAAVLMGVVARRTQRVAFVWAMLAGVLLAYNFSPVFFQELARAAIEQGAHAVNESRLPYAFYGLTYLPLIVGSLVAAKVLQRRGNELFARPLAQFFVGVSLLLLILAFGHVKALFPVAVLLSAMFAMSTVLLDDRRLALPALTAFLIAVVGAVPFAHQVWNVSVPTDGQFLAALGGAAVLLLIGPWLDSRIRRRSIRGRFLAKSELVESPTLLVSFAATMLTAVVWLPRAMVPTETFGIWTSVMTAGLLFAHSLVWTRKTTSWLCVAFLLVEGLRCGIAAHVTIWTLAEWTTYSGLVLWCSTYLFERRPDWRISRAWTEVGRLSATMILSLTTLFFAVPAMLIEVLDVPLMRSEFLAWPCYVLLTVWCFDAARRLRQPVTTCIGWVSLLAFVSWGVVRIAGHAAVEWLPLAWSITAVAALPVIAWLQRLTAEMDARIVTVDAYRSVNVILVPTHFIARGVLFLLAAVSLIVYDVPVMLASGVALTALVGWAVTHRASRLLPITLMLANWFLIAIAVQSFSRADHLLELVFEGSATSACLLAILAAASVVGWQLVRRVQPNYQLLANTQIAMLRIGAVLGLLASLPQAVVTPFDLTLATGAFLILTGTAFWLACVRQDVRRVWIGLGILTAAFAYFGWFELLHVGRGVVMFLPFAVGGGLSLMATIARRHERTAIFVNPFLTAGLGMPVMTVVIAIGRHLTQGNDVQWLGLNSLALLSTSGFYFWHAVERREKHFAVLSAAILNVAVWLLFRELRLSDPQFYLIPVGVSILVLVEVLKREIPSAWHNPLRYAGALIILVSPTFHILGVSWLPMLTLMFSATAVLLVAIGLRIRALMYTGTAFLIADLVAMVVRGGIEHPNLLWVVGIGFGAAVLMLGAVLENNREKMLQKLRAVSSQLEHWS